MQKDYYDRDAANWSLRNRDPVVGWYDEHERHRDYDDLLFPSVDTRDMIALDYGCGPGRCLVRFADRFKRVDGVDISQTNIEKARENLDANDKKNYLLWRANNGKDISFIGNETYDVVYSVICMQHICAFTVRDSIIRDIFRVLKPGGYFCFQMGFGGRSNQFVRYEEDAYGAAATNGHLDVSIMDEDEVRDHLQSIGFTDVKTVLRDPCCDTHKQWIWVQARKGE